MNERNPKMRYDNKLLQKYCNENDITLLKDYSNENLVRDTIINAKCLNCHEICSKNFRQFINSGCFCNSHTEENKKEKMKATCLERFGYEYASKSGEFKEKIKETCLEKYGCESSNQSEEVKKRKKITTLKNYSCENPSQSEKVKERKKITTLKNYGCESPLQSEEIKEKIKATCLEKYGCENPSQNAEISEKASKNAYKSHDYTFPSGRIEKIQGYEKYMLNDLLKEGILEEHIIVNRTEVPEAWYKDISGKKRRYFVDCFIKSQNRCIETKSTWTAEKKQDCVYLKQQALKDAGYKCEIWVYNGKGEIVEKIL